MPHLPTVAEQTSSIGLADGSSSRGGEGDDVTAVGKWEDEEERRFYEDVPDLKDFVPKSILGVDVATTGEPTATTNGDATDDEAARKREANDLLRLESEMEQLKIEPSAADDDE